MNGIFLNKDMDKKQILKPSKISIVIGIAIIIIIMSWLACRLTDKHYSDSIEFENKRLEMAIQEAINDYNITKKDAAQITVLTLENYSKITSLSDLKQFPNLKFLYINDCDIQSLEGIQYLTNLEVLHCNDNQIQDISLLYDTNLDKLYDISLRGNNIRSIDKLGEYLTELKNCDFSECMLYGEVDFGDNDNLEVLLLDGNYISKVSGKLPNLKIVNFEENNISSINWIVQYNELVELDLSDNLLSSIDGISSMKKLESIDIRNNKIKDISELERVKQLNSIYLDKNVDRKQIDFIIDNFKDGDICTKQYVVQEKNNLVVE